MATACINRAAFTVIALGVAAIHDSAATTVQIDRWTVTALADGTISGRAPAWSPTGQLIAYEADRDGRWQLQLLDVSSGRTEPLTSDVNGARFPAWSPDGRRLAFVSGQRGTALHFLDLASRRTELVADLPGAASFPSWSPDGRTVALTVQTVEGLRAWTVPLDRTPPSPLKIVGGRDVWPRWSPTGHRLAFFSRRQPHDDDDEVYIAEVDTSTVTRVTVRPGHDFCPSWHPSGERLAVVSVAEDTTQSIRVIGLDGRTIALPVSGYFRATEPSWAPDGRRLVFAGIEREGGSFRLFVASTDSP